MLIKSSRVWSSGPGYCYTKGRYLLLALCDSLETLRLCVTPAGVIVRAEPYAPNPRRTAYLIQFPGKRKMRNL